MDLSFPDLTWLAAFGFTAFGFVLGVQFGRWSLLLQRGWSWQRRVTTYRPPGNHPWPACRPAETLTSYPVAPGQRPVAEMARPAGGKHAGRYVEPGRVAAGSLEPRQFRVR